MLTRNEIYTWKREGAVLVKNLINTSLVDKCLNYVENLHQKNELNIDDFGSSGRLEFPTLSILDELSVNENIIKSVQTLLETTDIVLTQSDTWGKAGKSDFSSESNNDQRMHMDYGNNSFLHPSEWNEPECVSLIIYLSNVFETGGETRYVPRTQENEKFYQEPYTKMPGIGKFPFFNDKNNAENFFEENEPSVHEFRQELYEKEVIKKPTTGDILFYRLDLWHRGTPVFKNKIRFVTNLVFKRRECFWIHQWNPGWSKKMYYGHLENMIEKMTPLQRSILGIPPPGHEYWTRKKLEHLQARYPMMDINPYILQLK